MNDRPIQGKLPDFLVIGAQRSGTTSFYRLLCQHFFVKGAARKEVHYFDRPKHFRSGIQWYRALFPPPQSKGKFELTTGESTPYYLFHPLAARRAAHLVPQAKPIALLRNPIDRAYSNYQFGIRGGHETLPSFEEAIEVEAERLAGEREKISKEKLDYMSFAHQHYAYLSRGVYVDQIWQWRERFGKDNLLVLKSEDFFEKPQDTLARAQEHLGLPVRELRLPESQAKARPQKEESYPPMSPETRRKLEEYFEPHNKKLYEYLGKDFGW